MVNCGHQAVGISIFGFRENKNLYMKKLSLILLTSLLAVSCNQDKIAFVDSSKLIKEYQERIDLENTYKVKFEKFQSKLDSSSNSLQQELQAFQTDAKKMSQNNAQAKYNELMQKRQQLAQQLQNEEAILNQESGQAVDSLVKKIRTFVKDYGKTNGYTYILGENEGGNVFYGEASKDITDEVLRSLNNAYKEEK